MAVLQVPHKSLSQLPYKYPANDDPDNRIGCAEFIVPPNTSGPPAHWHEMHDEVFLVTTGTIRFHLPGSTHIDATPGDHVVIPPKAPHAFSNPTDKEARFYDTFTPAFYINYFKLVAQMLKDEKEGKGALNKEKMTKAMAYFATMGVEGTL